MVLDDPPLCPRESWRDAKEDADERLMKQAEKFGLRRLEPGDHLPPELEKRVKEFGNNVLYREGPPPCPKKKDDPLRSLFEYSLGVDPNMGTFLVCVCPWTGGEYWIGFGQSARIGTFLDKISAIQSEIGDEVEKDEKVVAQVAVCWGMDDILIESTPASTPAAYTASKKAKSDLLKLKASLVKEKTLLRQKEIDSLWESIHHIQSKLHTISAEFLSHWDLVAIPRFGLQDMIKRGGGSELGDKQKAILTQLAHCKFLDRFRTTARKRGCDIVEVGEAGSTKNCSYCNSKNSPAFNRFYHCRNCKRTMTRDGNAALNIFKMALTVAMMRLKFKGTFPDPSYEAGDDDDGDEDDGDEDDEVDDDDDMDCEQERVLDHDEVDQWAEDEKEKGEKRKRGSEDDGVDTCERGALRKSNVLSTMRDLSSGLTRELPTDIDPPHPVLNL
jgi:hypothetical protein